MPYSARLLLDSLAPSGGRLTTFEVTFPRIVLAEFNTHRVFSRNSASSRAIPVSKMLEKVRTDPFIPFYWGKNQKGMSANEELSEAEQQKAKEQWLLASDSSAEFASRLSHIGVHKQLTNRLLETFLFHTVIVTATEFDNWFALRANREAAPEIRKIAEEMLDLYTGNKPTLLAAGEWHLPLIHEEDKDFSVEDKIKLSVARCSRISYLTHDGVRAPEKDLEHHDKLLTDGHMSPFEHPAQALTSKQWQDHCSNAIEQWLFERIPVGNFWGWKQWRKTLRGEAVFTAGKS